MSRTLSIAIRCETAIDKGFGHLTRMIALAKALEEQYGARVAFLADPNPPAERLLRQEGFPCVLNRRALSEEEFVEREAESARVVIVDKKWEYPEPFVRALGRSRAVVLVDYCSPGVFAANLAIFPCAALAPEVIDDPRWAAAKGALLHGPEFVLMNRKILELWQSRGASCHARGAIVLTTGACDPQGVMLVVLPWLARLPADREIRVLVGDAFAHPRELERLKARLPAHIRISSYSEYRLAGAALAICTFGVTTYELMFLGVPALVIGHSIENARTSRILEERCRATVDLGYVGNLGEKEFMGELSNLLQDEARRRELSRSGLERVDGLGAERMAGKIVALAA
jgi:spore coat polysaccharide biosynthesis predicted glycosyltransferase SpsG